ncbi:MAG: peroxiredoxin family protein [Acidobacteria bacterium]|nr:peroxiredoxin family protein [Acidobacteriota bacterium]
MASDHEKFKAAGAEILAISVDPPEKSRDFASKLKLPFPLFSDIDHKVIDAYGVYDAENKISKPAVFMIDKKGIVQWLYVGKDRADRPLNDVLLAELGKLN